MKRIISILLIVALIFTMNISVFAAKDAILTINIFGSGNSTTITKNTAGTAGKLSTETVWKLEKTASYARIYGDMNFDAAVEKDGTQNYKYSVLKVNVKPTSADTKMQFRDETGGKYVAMPITAGKLEVGKWNSILMYIDYTTITKDNYSTEFPKSTIYLNGAKYYDYTQDALTSRIGLYDGSDVLKKRIYLHFENSPSGSYNDVEVEVADIQWYTTDTLPSTTAETETARPELPTNSVVKTVSGADVTVANASTPKSINDSLDNGYRVIAYNDTGAIADDTKLVSGNTLALEKTTTLDSRNVVTKTYNYYTVASVEAPVLKAPSGCNLVGNEIFVTSSTTVKDIKDANTPNAIAAYADSTKATPLQENDKFAQGNVVVIGEGTSSAEYTIGALSVSGKTIDGGVTSSGLVYADGASGTSVDGSLGKSSAEKVVYFNGTKTSSYIYEGTAPTSVDADGNKKYNYYVLKFNYLPKVDMTMMLTTNSHQIANVIAPENVNKDRWNSVLMYVDYSAIDKNYDYSVGTILEADKAKVFPVGHIYVNGEKIGNGYSTENLDERFGMPKAAFNTGAATQNVFKIRFSGATPQALIDDYQVYQTNDLPDGVAETSFTALADSEDFIVENSSVNIIGNKTLQALTDENQGYTFVAYENSTMATALTATDNLESGNMLAVADSKNTIAYFTVNKISDDEIFINGDNYDSTSKSFTSGGNVTFKAKPSKDSAVLIVAQFNADGTINTVLSDSEVDGNGLLSVEFNVLDNLGASEVKSFLWADKGLTMKPLAESANAEINGVKKKVLIIGNSFSVDTGWWINEVAAAQGDAYEVGILNWGASDIGMHNDAKESLTWYNPDKGVTEDTQNYFVYDDKTNTDPVSLVNPDTGKYIWTLEKVLADYGWNYVIMQNWGDTAAFYENTDENYAENWAPMVELAEYIHQKEPFAELMINNTWSFETGYSENFAMDDETRDKIGESIRALNKKCAEDCAAAIGLSKPLRILDSGAAFDAARVYDNGKFNTTYASGKHTFTVGEGNCVLLSNGQKQVTVGDGSMLLSYNDFDAGKIGLHRDGFHANHIGRYLLALNAYKTLSGKAVTGNTYATALTRLKSAEAGTGTDENMDTGNAVYQVYDPVNEATRNMIQAIIDGMN